MWAVPFEQHSQKFKSEIAVRGIQISRQTLVRRKLGAPRCEPNVRSQSARLEFAREFHWQLGLDSVIGFRKASDEISPGEFYGALLP